ncbi:MAG: hypothetical protein EBS01_02310 [Verrucomicrobia bacterium]|nr:hypothetical protein [Verrucomicrobiota bacterium]
MIRAFLENLSGDLKVPVLFSAQSFCTRETGHREDVSAILPASRGAPKHWGPHPLAVSAEFVINV